MRDRDNALAAFESAEAAVAAARAALRTAELELSYTDVRAPIAGLTSREVRSEGSLVTAGGDSSLLTYIVQADRLYVDLAVADTDADLVRAALASDARRARRRAASRTRRAESIGAMGTIEFVSPRVDDATGTVAIRAVLDNPGGIVPGRIVRARIEGVSIAELARDSEARRHARRAGRVRLDRRRRRPTRAGAGRARRARRQRRRRDGRVSRPARASSSTALLKVRPGSPVNAVPIAEGTAQK